MGARKPGDYPGSLLEFLSRFPDEAACQRYLIETRWPDGFRCPHGQGTDAYLVKAGRVSHCRSCRRQSSITASTIMERTHLPLRVWFIGAYVMASLKPGISALQFSRQMGVTLKTAWFVLHKLRARHGEPGPHESHRRGRGG